jgi:hypothetical protein
MNETFSFRKKKDAALVQRNCCSAIVQLGGAFGMMAATPAAWFPAEEAQ